LICAVTANMNPKFKDRRTYLYYIW